MRCLIFNTSEIIFYSGDPATLPPHVINIKSEIDNIPFHNVSVCFVCVENNDLQKDADIIKTELIKYFNNHKLPILIVPFGHLSSNIPSDRETAPKLIKYLHMKLVELNIAIKQENGFGYDRRFILKWATLLHKTNVAFRDSKII